MRVSRTKVNQLQYCSIKLANGANYRISKLSSGVFVTFVSLGHIHGRHERGEHYLASKKFLLIIAWNA